MKKKVTALILVLCIVAALAAPCAMAVDPDVLLRLAVASKQKELSELVLSGGEMESSYAVSTDGSDVAASKQWVKQSVMDALKTELATAREFLQTYKITSTSTSAEISAYLTMINNVKTKLQTAVNAATDSARYGSIGKASVGLENFKKSRSYTQGQFTDVAATHGFAANVQTAYELGLMDGRGSEFGINGTLTVAEAITMAARLHSIYYTGAASFKQGGLWYQVYVDYAIANGIMKDGQFNDYDRDATRAEFAQLFAAAFPSEALAAKNQVDDGAIPDVYDTTVGRAAIYTLYRAGIVIGSDAAGNYRPESSITRGEAAAIMTRMADTTLRKSVTLTK